MNPSELLTYTEAEKIDILKRFNTNVENVNNTIVRLKEWALAQPHFTEIPDDAVIEKLLLTNKFDGDKTKAKITMYYLIRHLLPELFCRDPNSAEMMEASKYFFYVPLPKLNLELSRVVIFCLTDIDMSNFDPVLYFAYTINCAEIRLREDYRFKELQIYDLKNITLGVLTKISPIMMRKLAFVMEKLFDGNVLGIHFLNVPSYVESLVGIVRSILKGKLQERVIIHKTVESLYDVVPKANLPKEYGGDAGTLVEFRESWKKKFLEYDPVFKHLCNVQLNMDYLPEKLKIDDHFGVHGNFRKLDVD